MGAIMRKNTKPVLKDEERLLAQQRFEKTVNFATNRSIAKLEEQGYCVLDPDDLEGLVKKAPALYDRVYKDGYQAGQKNGKEKEANFNKIMVKANERKMAAKEQVAEKDFETLVAEYQEEHKCRKGRAIMFVANSHPAAHKDYVAKLSKPKKNEPEKENVGSRNGTESKFMTLVDEYQKEHKCSRTEAVKAIVKSHPEEHAKLIAA